MTREEREKAIDLLDNLIGMMEDNQGNDYDFALRMGIEALKQEPKTAWIPLKWEIEGISCDIPEELDGNCLLFTDGKSVSIERIKKDAQDHFYPDGRCFELEDAVAWMPLPKLYKTESEVEDGNNNN